MTDDNTPARPDTSNPDLDAYDPDEWGNCYDDTPLTPEPESPQQPLPDDMSPQETQAFYDKLQKLTGQDMSEFAPTLPTSAPITPDPFTPAPRQRVRQCGWTAERQRVFIAALADTGLVIDAAHEAGMSTRSAYQLRRNPDAQSFARAWDMAIAHATRQLTDIAFHRAIKGVQEPVFDRDGNMKGMKSRLNDRLLMFLLRHHRRDIYGIGDERVFNMKDRAEVDKRAEGYSPVPEALAALENSDMPVGDEDYGFLSMKDTDGEGIGDEGARIDAGIHADTHTDFEVDAENNAPDNPAIPVGKFPTRKP